MVVEEIKEAVKNNSIDQVLALAKYITADEVDELLEIYEKYYMKELNISKTVQNILARIRTRRFKNIIPNTGCYTYKLEE